MFAWAPQICKTFFVLEIYVGENWNLFNWQKDGDDDDRHRDHYHHRNVNI